MRFVYGMSSQNVLTCFIWMEMHLLVRAATGDACDRPYTKPCVNQGGNYIESLYSCVFYNVKRILSWQKAKSYCEKTGGGLVEPNSPVKAKSLNDLAKKNKWQESWIGLSYDDEKEQYFWASNWRPLEKDHIPVQGSVGKCVKAMFRDTLEWGKGECRKNKTFLCSTPSELMPARPSVSADRDLRVAKLEVGSPLVVKCEAILSLKGDLKIAIISNDRTQLINQVNNPNVIYNESLVLDHSYTCKRHGTLTLTLMTTPDLAGKTLACVSFIDRDMKMCSRYDPYCHVAGTLNIKVPVVMWWLLLVILIVVVLTGLALALSQIYINGPSGGGEEDGAESSTGSGSNS